MFSELSQDTAWPEYFIKASPSSDSLSVPGFLYPELGEVMFLQPVPPGRPGWANTKCFLVFRSRTVFAFPSPLSTVSLVLCVLPPLCSSLFFLSVQRRYLTPKILELRSGMLRRQALSLSLRGNSSWWNPSYLAFQPRACRRLHLSCIPRAPQTLESREENRHFWGAIHLSPM